MSNFSSSSEYEDEYEDGDDYNIIVNVKKLKKLITDNFTCKFCAKKRISTRGIHVNIFSNGPAVTNISCTCLPHDKRKKPHQCNIEPNQINSKDKRKAYHL